MERLLHLRSMPSIGGMDGDGLTYLAHRSVERRYAKGEDVFSPENPVRSVHFVVEGAVRVMQEGAHLLDCRPPWAIGFLPVLSKSPIGQHAYALEDTVTLEVTQADILELMESDFGFLATGIRQLSRQLLEYQAKLEKNGRMSRSEPDDEVPYPEKELDLVERLSLSRFGPYEDVNLAALLQMVRQQREVRWPPGHVIWREGDFAADGFHVVYGVVHCHSAERDFRMGPKSVLGFLESNGLLARSYTATTETEVVALQSTTEGFFDVLEDNFGLAFGFLSFVSGWVMQLSIRCAEMEAELAAEKDAAE